MINGTIIQFFHWYNDDNGTLWDEAAAQAEQLSSLGINAIWLPPAYKSSEGAVSNGYDVYDVYDLGEFDQKNTIRTKFGTKGTIHKSY